MLLKRHGRIILPMLFCCGSGATVLVDISQETRSQLAAEDRCGREQGRSSVPQAVWLLTVLIRSLYDMHFQARPNSSFWKSLGKLMEQGGGMPIAGLYMLTLRPLDLEGGPTGRPPHMLLDPVSDGFRSPEEVLERDLGEKSDDVRFNPLNLSTFAQV